MDGTAATTDRRWRAEAAVLLKSGDHEGARAAIGRAKAGLTQGMGEPSALDIEPIDAIARDLASAVEI